MHAPSNTTGNHGDLVYRKVKGKTIVALKRDADLPLKQGEIAHRQDFTKAAEWATAALRNEEMRQT